MSLTFILWLDIFRGNRRFTEAGLPNPHSCRCGFEAFYPSHRKDAKIVFPLKPTMKVDKVIVYSIWKGGSIYRNCNGLVSSR